MEMVLFHGSENHNKFEKNVFFSTSEDFSEAYGEVKQYNVNLNKVFDTLNETHVKLLIESVNGFYEPYDETDIDTYEDYLNTPYYACDNWEMFEQYIDSIKNLGFDSMKIFEGGYENYCVFHNNFKLLEKINL